MHQSSDWGSHWDIFFNPLTWSFIFTLWDKIYGQSVILHMILLNYVTLIINIRTGWTSVTLPLTLSIPARLTPCLATLCQLYLGFYTDWQHTLLSNKKLFSKYEAQHMTLLCYQPEKGIFFVSNILTGDFPYIQGQIAAFKNILDTVIPQYPVADSKVTSSNNLLFQMKHFNFF